MKRLVHSGMPYLEKDAEQIVDMWFEHITQALSEIRLATRTQVEQALLHSLSLNFNHIKLKVFFVNTLDKSTDGEATVIDGIPTIEVSVAPISQHPEFKARTGAELVLLWRQARSVFRSFYVDLIEHELVHVLQKQKNSPIPPSLLTLRQKQLDEYLSRLQKNGIEPAVILSQLQRDRDALIEVLENAENRSEAGFARLLKRNQIEHRDHYSDHTKEKRYLQQSNERQAWVVDIAKHLLSQASLEDYLEQPSLIIANLPTDFKQVYLKEHRREIVTNIMRYFSKKERNR